MLRSLSLRASCAGHDLPARAAAIRSLSATRLVLAPRPARSGSTGAAGAFGRRHDRPARRREASRGARRPRRCGSARGRRAAPARAPPHRCARRSAAASAVSVCGGGAASPGTTGGGPSSVIANDLVFERRGNRPASASNVTRGLAEHATRPPSTRTTAPPASRRRSSRRTAPARTAPVTGALGSGVPLSVAVTVKRRAPATGAPPKISMSRARVERHHLLPDEQLAQRVEHDRRAGARRRQAAQRHAVRLRSRCAACSSSRATASACVSCASTLTAGGSGGRSPFTSVVSKRTLKSHHRISNVALPLTRSGRGPSSAPFSADHEQVVRAALQLQLRVEVGDEVQRRELHQHVEADVALDAEAGGAGVERRRARRTAPCWR